MDKNCPICFGIGWVCEKYPDRAWPGSRADATADESDISEVLIEDVATHWPHTERTGVARLAVGNFGLSKQRRLDPVRDIFLAHRCVSRVSGSNNPAPRCYVIELWTERGRN
jgi:hypothetical protein